MAFVTENQSLFQSAYGTPGVTLSFGILVEGSRRIDAILEEQILHPTITYLFLVERIRGRSDIDVFNYAFDTDLFSIGSTNSELSSKRPAIKWTPDSAIRKLDGYQFLWVISPNDDPFSLQTDAGFRGIVPTSGETTFFFSEDMGVSNLKYNYTGGTGVLGESTWQGDPGTWQSDPVSW